jgi:hypothetical protein
VWKFIYLFIYYYIQNDACSLPKRGNKWRYFKYLLTRQQMVFHLFFVLTVSIRSWVLFPTSSIVSSLYKHKRQVPSTGRFTYHYVKRLYELKDGLLANIYQSFFFLPTLNGVDTKCFSSCCDKDSAIIFTTGRLPDVKPPWEQYPLCQYLSISIRNVVCKIIIIVCSAI